jgi:DNA-binding beta-propeller fold protein YncE
LAQHLAPPPNIGILSSPAGLCLDSNGRLHIADWGNCRIVTFDFDTSTWTAFGTGILGHPLDVASDGDGRIYAADGEHVIRFDSHDGSNPVVLPLGTPDQRPVAISVDGEHMFVADTRSRGLWYSHDQGGSWGSLVLPEGDQPIAPLSLSSRREGGVLVTDLANRRVIAIDSAGATTTIITEQDGLVAPIAAIQDGPGITVIDAGAAWLRRFLPVGSSYVAADFVRAQRADGSFRFERPSGLAIGAPA